MKQFLLEREKLEYKLSHIADLLYSLRVEESFKELPAITDRLREYVEKQRENGINSDFLTELNQLLILLLACLEYRDYILAADVIKYELLPRLMNMDV